MKTHFNGLKPAEAERLALLAEEMGETIQVIGKILRHGYCSYDPAKPTTTNRDLLERELGDVMAVLGLMVQRDDVGEAAIDRFRIAKLRRVEQFLHHNTVNP